jgi:hypothetical protein
MFFSNRSGSMAAIEINFQSIKRVFYRTNVVACAVIAVSRDTRLFSLAAVGGDKSRLFNALFALAGDAALSLSLSLTRSRFRE